MRGWIAALLGLMVLAGCGGEEETTAAAKPEATSSGGERAGAAIEVDESALRAPARVEIVEMVPVPVPAPLAETPAGERPEAMEGQAEAEMQMDEPSTWEPGAEAQAEAGVEGPAGIEAEAGVEAQPGVEAQAELETPSLEMPSAEGELELEGEGLEGEGMARAPEGNALCPTDIPGLHAVSTQTRNGAILTLTTSRASEVRELRSRARQLASMLDEERAGEACPIDESGAPAPERATHFLEGDTAIHQVRDVRLTDTPRGVRIEFIGYADDQELIDQLHTQVSEDARSLREGLCPLSFQTI